MLPPLGVVAPEAKVLTKGRNFAYAGACFVLAAYLEVLLAPATVVQLVVGQPDQGCGHRPFGMPATTTDN